MLLKTKTYQNCHSSFQDTAVVIVNRQQTTIVMETLTY